MERMGGGLAVWPLLDGNSAGARPAAPGIAQAAGGGAVERGGRAKRCPPPIAVGMVMIEVFAECAPQGALPKENDLGQAFLLHRPDPALRIRIQVRAPRRQCKRLNPT